MVNFAFYIQSKYTFHGHHGISTDSFAKIVNIKLVKEPYFAFLYELQQRFCLNVIGKVYPVRASLLLP